MSRQARVGVNDLRAIPPGATRTFLLPNRKRCLSARVACTNLKNMGEGEWSTSIDFDERSITITRIR